eukprot:gene7748-627_t
MELARSVEDELRTAARSEDVDDESFQKILEWMRNDLLHREKDNDRDLESVDRLTKRAYNGLLTFIVEAFRQNPGKDSLTSMLDDLGFSEQRKDHLFSLFQEHIIISRSQLRRISSELPHVVDVNWRLDYVTKDSHLEAAQEPIYTVSLKTETAGQTKHIEFACSVAELQDFVSALKDVQKSIEDLRS